MHNAPSVSYPVGRCSFLRQLYLSLMCLTSAVLLTWALKQGWRDMGFVPLILTGLGAAMGWRAQHQVGVLTWDGQVWCLHDQGCGADDALGTVSVALDVQTTLLLRWQPTSDTGWVQPRWLWLGLENKNHQQWQALRCAVYQSHESEMKEKT